LVQARFDLVRSVNGYRCGLAARGMRAR